MDKAIEWLIVVFWVVPYLLTLALVEPDKFGVLINEWVEAYMYD